MTLCKGTLANIQEAMMALPVPPACAYEPHIHHNSLHVFIDSDLPLTGNWREVQPRRERRNGKGWSPRRVAWDFK